MAWTPSTYARAPASRAASVIARTSGRVPIALEAAVTATRRVRSDRTRSTAAAGSSPVSASKSATRTVAPARSAASRHGRTLASWSSDVTTTSSPGAQVREMASAKWKVSVVMFGPRTTPSGVPPTQVRDRRPGVRDDLAARARRGERAALVGHGGAQRVGDRLDDGGGHLRAGRAVERRDVR